MLVFREGKINSRTFWGYQHKQRFAYPQCPIRLVVLHIAKILTKITHVFGEVLVGSLIWKWLNSSACL